MPFPDGMLVMTWAKANWMEACKMVKTWIAYNTELVKLVSDYLHVNINTNSDLL